VDLDNGATFADIPAPVLERLLKDITGAWKTRGTDTGLHITITGTDTGLHITITGTDLVFGDTTTEHPTHITGPLPAVVQWATGRGTDGVTATGPGTTDGTVPAAPKWI